MSEEDLAWQRTSLAWNAYHSARAAGDSAERVERLATAWLRAEAEYRRITGEQSGAAQFVSDVSDPFDSDRVSETEQIRSETEAAPDQDEQVMADADPGGEERGQRQAVPIPTELHTAVTKNLVALAGLLRQSSAAKEAQEQAFNAKMALTYDDPRYDEKDAAFGSAYDKARREYGGLQGPISATIRRVREAVHAVELFFIDAGMYDADGNDDELGRRRCAVETFASGAYAVVVSEVADLDHMWDIEYTVRPYLQGRLGYTDEGARGADKRIRHASRETVLDGVALNDAVHVKEELASLGCKAQVVEGRPL